MILRPLSLAAAAMLLAAGQPADARPNMLFIVVDDLRPVLGCYGHSVVKSPNIDRLAKRGVVFERAYCQVASCCPSRTAVLTGLRPETTGVFTNASPHFRTKVADCITLPGYFKQHGYFCKELGKVFHRRDSDSWSEPKWIPETDYAYPIYGTDAARRQQRLIRITPKPDDWWGFRRWIKVNSWEAPEVPDETLFDGQLATQAIAELRRRHEKPFFLALGFFRPHLPFIAPRKYFDLYPQELLYRHGESLPGESPCPYKNSLELPADKRLPPSAPECSAHASLEPRSYVDVSRSGQIPLEKQKELLRGYFAAVSYVDAQIGRVLDDLERSGLQKNTIIVLWSDHGYHLGDHGIWGKNTNFERAVRSTLIVSVPAVSPGRTRGLVALLDIYPTLCELCRLPEPADLAGESFARLLRSPKGAGKPAVYSQASPRRAKGYSVRTDRYRFTQWHRDGEIVAEELYDYEAGLDETKNIVRRADAKLAAHLRSLLRQTPALPNDKGTP